ncbi:hypothetical protein Patl1_16256 [Pistacia atlantica]|uniref:Uncharacterized protein n=1 Tax=Pistacia atlantica TaxID=434234 RepID=A0ACC1BB22_9ROSI|nr:hypothetical protein Patl1_16256 [Pistacia atlantica]
MGLQRKSNCKRPFSLRHGQERRRWRRKV